MHIGSACGVFELNIRSNTSTIGLILVAIPARIYANMAAVTLENGYRLTAQSIPNLVFNPYQTMSSSYSQDQFVGALRHWTQFESQVRENFITLQPHLVQNILSVCATQPRHNDVCFEQLLCGDESTVAARFNQHVGHVMTSVVQELGVDSRFGDSRCSLGVERVRSVPDFAFIDRNGQALLIGEAKTPWIHNLERAIQYGGASGPSLNLVLGGFPPVPDCCIITLANLAIRFGRPNSSLHARFQSEICILDYVRADHLSQTRARLGRILGIALLERHPARDCLGPAIRESS